MATKTLSKSEGNVLTMLRQYWYCSKFSTANSTPLLVTSFAIPQRYTYDISTTMKVCRADGSTRNVGTIRGVFSRVTGNISQDGTLALDLRGVLSTARVGYTINNTSKEVEIYANGLALTDLNWNIGVEVVITPDT